MPFWHPVHHGTGPIESGISATLSSVFRVLLHMYLGVSPKETFGMWLLPYAGWYPLETPVRWTGGQTPWVSLMDFHLSSTTTLSPADDDGNFWIVLIPCTRQECVQVQFTNYKRWILVCSIWIHIPQKSEHQSLTSSRLFCRLLRLPLYPIRLVTTRTVHS